MDDMPSKCIKNARIKIPSKIEMADPNYNNESPIDLLIGSSLFLKLLSIGQIRLDNTDLILQKTVLGWIIAGDVTLPQSKMICNLVTNKMLDKRLEKFWEIENCYTEESKTNKGRSEVAEAHFINNIKRNAEGRFVVSIPFKDNVRELGNSEEMAKSRLISMEKKLSKDATLRQQYCAFMAEYEELGHLTEINPADSKDDLNYYLPHHAVLKQQSTTTKLRVVFDGSAKTSSGLSLNDVQHIGPTIQDDIFSILIRFRKYRVVLSADITKMYRQIIVEAEQCCLQRIVWCTDTSSPIKHYQLNTVTYGTTSAPFLATRCLKELSNMFKEQDKTTSNIIANDFYVDDLLTGADNFEDAASNDARVCAHSTDENHQNIKISDEKDPRTLGLLWNPNSDTLTYCVNIIETTTITKRTITSLIAQIFDPLGLVGPAIIQAKLILQTIWDLKLNWDESLPQYLHTIWHNTYKELGNLNKLKISRPIMQNSKIAEFHGFSDASESAYGACIYVCSEDNYNKRSICLLCAKSRVAPLKKIQLPKLELLGALLLARLSNKVAKAFKTKPEQWYYWSDSTIALSWIRSPSNKWQTFVANRITEIQELTNDNWSHVDSTMNPADVISRGMNATELLNSTLWWNGPAWLKEVKSKWPSSSKNPKPTMLERKRSPQDTLEIHVITDGDKMKNSTKCSEIFKEHSSYLKLKRMTAYSMIFISNCRRGINKEKTIKSQGDKNTIKKLTTIELETAENLLIKIAQHDCFQDEIKMLQKGEDIRTSPLAQLQPFLDNNQLIRVGGRLQNAYISYDQKHPLILASSHRLTYLIIKNEHERLLHAGCQAVIASLRTKYWPLSIKNTVKNILRDCVKCFRARPAIPISSMGNLPSSRITPVRPFAICGVDYAGPFLIRDKLRAKTALKAYMCIFVCFVTKAVHIELASDLSTEAFLNCLKRFIARRGRCTHIYSDNGKNFVGASGELSKLYNIIKKHWQNEVTSALLLSEHITWHFIPPYAPHFGGLWESAVKSAKYHLTRVIGGSRLTYEDFYTMLTQIEACLNSRPLSPLSNDPNDLTPLTPGHFLIGDSLMALPQSDTKNIKILPSNRYQYLQQMLQHFWSRWKQEYLHQLQTRYKRSRSMPTLIRPGTMVLVIEENTHPMQWPLGRICEVHPGKDNIIRVVSIKTARGIIKRAISKICVLPIKDNEEATERETNPK